jgi:hypothetical protein
MSFLSDFVVRSCNANLTAVMRTMEVRMTGQFG